MRKLRVLKIITICLFLLAVILYLAIPIGFGGYASVRHSAPVGDPPEGFKELTLTTNDGVKLAAWYAPPKNGAAIVLIHGATGSRENIRPYAHMLAGNGFGVLAFDLRGHGESGGGGNAFGWEGTRDVNAAMAYLLEQDNIEAIGGLGISLGGEVLLGAASASPELKAIVSDGASHRSTDDYLILPSQRSLFRSWTTRLMYVSTHLFSGDTPPITMLDSIEGSQGTPLLLIAAGNDSKEIDYNSRFLEAAGPGSELWIVPDVGHTGAYQRYPDDYMKRILAFFELLLKERS